jgi:hypothetical protein
MELALKQLERLQGGTEAHCDSGQLKSKNRIVVKQLSVHQIRSDTQQ